MNINELAQEIHKNAVEHGWWERDRDFPEIAALIHSEISSGATENPTIALLQGRNRAGGRDGGAGVPHR